MFIHIQMHKPFLVNHPQGSWWTKVPRLEKMCSASKKARCIQAHGVDGDRFPRVFGRWDVDGSTDVGFTLYPLVI